MSTKSFSLILACALVFSACQPAPSPAMAPTPSAANVSPTATALPAATPTMQADPIPTPDTSSPPRPTLLPNLAEPLSFEAKMPPGIAVHLFKLNQPVLAEEVGYEQVWAALKDQSRWVQSRENASPATQELVTNANQLETLHLLLGAEDLYAAMESIGGTIPKAVIRVYRGQKQIFEISCDDTFVRPPLYGLWTYGEHWVLEVLDSIVMDGQAVNSKFGYQKSYEFHLLGGKPVYLFEKSGQLGVNFDGQEVLLPGQSAHHYECCSGTLLNPRLGASELVFFMANDQQWVYVELESLEKQPVR